MTPEQTIRALAERFAAMERRLHALETAPRAPHTSVRGGFTRWIPEGDAENPKLYLGSDGAEVFLALNVDSDSVAEVFVGTVAGLPRVFVSSPDSADRPVFQVLDGVMTTPLPSCAWQRYGFPGGIDTAGRSTTTSASYVELHRTVLPITAGRVDGFIDLVPGVGQTMDARIRGAAYRGGAAEVTIAEMTGVTANDLLFGPWDVPDTVNDPASNAIGSLVEFKLEVRRTAGANPVAVAPRTPVVNAI